MDKKKLQGQIAAKLPKGEGLVSQRIKPKHEEGGANIRSKANGKNCSIELCFT